MKGTETIVVASTLLHDPIGLHLRGGAQYPTVSLAAVGALKGKEGVGTLASANEEKQTQRLCPVSQRAQRGVRVFHVIDVLIWSKNFKGVSTWFCQSLRSAARIL